MKYGIFYEIEIPKPWHERSEYEVFQQVLEQVELADRMGFDYFWTVEHHFLSEFSHCSAPEVLYGAVSQRTRRIRIGHGVVLLPFPYNHPIRVAERIATLDLLSHGRVDFGTGRSATLEELGGFGIPPEEARPRWEEALEMIPKMWTEEVFSWEGKYFKIPPRSVIPKPLQKPHPPIWMAATGPGSHELAGRKGLGLLSFTVLVGPEKLAQRIEHYRRGLKEARPAGAFTNNQAATFTLVYCAPTNEEARADAAEACVWYSRRAVELPWKLAESTGEATYQYFRDTWEKIPLERVTFDWLNERDMVIVGDPATCIEKVQKYQAAGIDQLLCHMQTYNIPHEKVMRSIRLFAEHVLPHFKGPAT